MLYEQINKIIWAIAIAMIFTSSIYFSLKLKFPQIKINKIFKYLKEQTTNQTMSIKDTLIMSLASKIGAGSLAGIAFAIYYGGPGTIFWMWVSAFICSIICYCENYLTTKYKEKDNDIYKGGPAYYIKKGLKSPILATTYSILAIMTYIFGFLAIQNNTITTLITNNFNIKPIIISLFIALLAGYIIIKGIKSTSKICNKLVPIMTSIYLIVGLIITITNINKIPQILLLILKQAFTNQAIKGGIFYTFIIGVQKGIFATEAAVGTSAIASGANCNKDPIKQGYIGIVETYFISFLIITTTAFIVLLFPYQNINLI